MTAAMGRDLPEPIRRLAEWRTSDVAELVAKARALDLITGPGRRERLEAFRDAEGASL